MSNNIDEVEKESRKVVTDMQFATTWTDTMMKRDSGSVQEVAELLGLSKAYVQQRSVQLRRELRKHGVELPKASNRQHKKKETINIANAISALLVSYKEKDSNV